MSDRWSENRRHWEATLDAQNLGRQASPVDLERQVALYDTADLRRLFAALEPLSGATVLDIGGGLALAAVLLARRGARVTIVDVSLPRLKEARRSLATLGLADRVDLVVGRAEEMPFRDSAFGRIMSKAVLIHTDLARAMGEIHRILAPGGTIGLSEPTRGNPFVMLYRRLFAPKIWAAITDYFSARELEIIQRTLPPGRSLELTHFYFFGFFATVFEFVWPNPALYRLTGAFFGAIDGVLFAILPPLRKLAWFWLLTIRTAGRSSRPGGAPGAERGPIP